LARNAGGHSVLPASVRDIGSLGVAESEEQRMKQELVRMARIMYDFQKRCMSLYWCTGCPAYTGKTCRLKAGKEGVPANWKITDADIERLENLEKGIAAIEELAESPEEKVI
jgi:hypothetical protein